jgi:hypothetical protein
MWRRASAAMTSRRPTTAQRKRKGRRRIAEFQFRYNNRENKDIFGAAIVGC